MVFWILVKIGDQVFRAVLDTGATLSIVARRLLKTFRKTKTVAIRVGDGRTIHSLGGVDVTICLGDETVTQHCRVLDTDAFVKVLPWVVVGAGGLGAGKTSGAGTRGVSLDVVIGCRTGHSDTNGGESSDNRSKVHADCGPAENPSL